MNKNANYRKMNDGSQNSSTYHKKDGTNVRAKLKEEMNKAIKKKYSPFDDSPEYHESFV